MPPATAAVALPGLLVALPGLLVALPGLLVALGRLPIALGRLLVALRRLLVSAVARSLAPAAVVVPQQDITAPLLVSASGASSMAMASTPALPRVAAAAGAIAVC